MQDYMKEQQLPSALKHRVLDFFEYLWVRNKGTDRQSLLSDLPYCMQAEVSLATTESLLRKVLLNKQYNYSFWFTYIPILDWVPPSIYAVGTNYLSIYMAIKWTARPLICTLEFHLAKLLVKLPGTNSQSVHSACYCKLAWFELLTVLIPHILKQIDLINKMKYMQHTENHITL